MPFCIDGNIYPSFSKRRIMNTGSRLFTACAGIVVLLILAGICSALTPDAEFSFTGQVIWQDIEGGFYGIITPDGTGYLPLNLPESYQVDGVTVDVVATPAPDAMTIQMWGEPVEILSLTPVNANNPFVQLWYVPDSDDSEYPDEDQAEHLIMAASGLQTGLNTIDNRVSAIAQNLTRNGIMDEDIRSILHEGLDLPGVYYLSYMDEAGRVTAIVPDRYEQFEGEDVSGQDYASRLLLYPAPSMSQYFSLNEGMDAVILSNPVFTADNRVAGFISAIINPASFTELYALPLLNGTDYDLMVAQPDGTLLYDAHPDMNGQKTWNNSIFNEFPDLLSWSAHYQNAQAGTDRYTYFKDNSEEITKTDVIWATVSLHGTPWRIFIMHRES